LDRGGSASHAILLVGLVLSAAGLLLAGALAAAGSQSAGQVAIVAAWVLIATPPTALLRGTAALGGGAMIRAFIILAVLGLGIGLRIVLGAVQ
jgi:hypothetical protein